MVVLGSGSRGNCFALVHDGAVLLLDAGFPAREIERRLAGAGLSPGAVIGIAVTHEHGDHAAGATTFARRHSVPLATSSGTWRAISGGGDPCEWLPLGSRAEAEIGPFVLQGCPTPHDAAEPLALGVTVAGGTTLALATDIGTVTQGLRWFLRERHCLIIEANHDELMLRRSSYPLVVQERIASNDGHLSNSSCASLLCDLHHPELRLVVLAHRSLRCNTPELAGTVVGNALREAGFAGRIHLAEQHGPMPPIPLGGPIQHLLELGR